MNVFNFHKAMDLPIIMQFPKFFIFGMKVPIILFYLNFMTWLCLGGNPSVRYMILLGGKFASLSLSNYLWV